MAERVRWGLLSTANINRALIPVIRSSDRGELVAVASRTPARAEAYAQEWRIPLAFGSYKAMLASGEVDAVYIGLPNHLHAEWSIRAMEQGVHVLCEKPFAISLSEVDAMIAATERTGMVLAEAFMYRHHPQTKMIGEWLQSGHLGEIATFYGVFNFALHNRDNVRLVLDWGGGSLWDVGVYPLSFAQYVMGGPPLFVSGNQWIGASGVDETFTGQLHYDGDRLAQISCSFRSPFHTGVELYGTAGRLDITRPFNNMAEGEVIFYPTDGEPQHLPVPEKELYLGEVEDMHAAILDGAAPYLTLAETRNHVRTVLALYESARERQVVLL
jgi:D-xylose 1-dehydrogenase (NADP+, D-xylono-1,5-lactone-forming)